MKITESDIYFGFVGGDLGHINGGIGWTAEAAGRHGAKVYTLAQLTGVMRRDAIKAATRWTRSMIRAAEQTGQTDYHGVPYPGAAQDAQRMLRMAAKETSHEKV